MCQHRITWQCAVEVLEPAGLREQLSNWAGSAANITPAPLDAP
jgi:hypothetical protein